MPTIMLDKMGTIGNTQGVKAKARPAKKKMTAKVAIDVFSRFCINQLALVPRVCDQSVVSIATGLLCAATRLTALSKMLVVCGG